MVTKRMGGGSLRYKEHVIMVISQIVFLLKPFLTNQKPISTPRERQETVADEARLS